MAARGRALIARAVGAYGYDGKRRRSSSSNSRSSAAENVYGGAIASFAAATACYLVSERLAVGGLRLDACCGRAVESWSLVLEWEAVRGLL